MKAGHTIMTPAALTCRELVEIITNYLEDAMSAAERERFEEHLTMCGGCREYLEQMRLTIRAVGSLSEDSLTPVMKDDLLQAFRDWKREQPAAPPRRRGPDLMGFFRSLRRG